MSRAVCLLKLYSPVIVVLGGAAVAARHGVGYTVVFLVMLAWSIVLHISARKESRENPPLRKQRR